MEALTLFADILLKVLYVGFPIALFIYIIICSIDVYKAMKAKYPSPSNDTKDDDDSDLGIFMQ